MISIWQSTVPRSAAPAGGRFRRRALGHALAALCGALLLAGCQSSGSEGESQGVGTTLRNFALYGGATVPPEAPLPEDDLICPPFDIFEGGSAVRSGEGHGLRYQLSIRDTARECFANADGSRSVNVGVEVLALLGPAGSPGTFSAPLRIVVKRDKTVVDSRTRQVSITIPAGSAQNVVRIVEEGLRLPQDVSGVLIEIGLGAPTGRAARR